MFWNRYLLPSILLLALVSALNWLANAQDYYYTTNWYDFMMHFLGGLSISFLILWLLNLSIFNRFRYLSRALCLIFLVLIIGVFWEYFELYFGLTHMSDVGYAWDTAHDIIMDILGAVVAVWVSKISFSAKTKDI
mgnify:CR=1 FL=1